MRQFQLRPLSQPERLTLEEMYRNAKKPRCRQRAHLILLAEKKYPLKTISEIVGICYHSVCHYVQAFNQDGFLALYDAKRSGRKPSLTAAQREQIATWLEFSPRALHYQQGCWTIQLMARRIKAVYQVTLTLERVRQIIHEAGFTLVRPKHESRLPDPKAVETAKQELEEFEVQAKRGEIILFYQDEARLSRFPTITRMWGKQRHSIPHPNR